jgi:hypothetical protein
MLLKTISDWQPVTRLDYDVDGVDWLISGDTFASITGTVQCITTPTNTAFTLPIPMAVNGTKIKVWGEGGDDGEDYKVSGTFTTVGGRRNQFELVFKVREV